jgi:hypothetical protein
MACWNSSTEASYVVGLPAAMNLLRDISNPNAGGVGQVELTVVVQSAARLRYLDLLVFSVAGTPGTSAASRSIQMVWHPNAPVTGLSASGM